MEGGATSMASAITSAVTAMVGIITTNVTPLVTTEPFVYFLAIGLISGAAGIFAKLRRTVH